MIICIDTEEAFDSTQNPFMIVEAFGGLGKEGNFHGLIEVICIGPTLSIENFLQAFGNV